MPPVDHPHGDRSEMHLEDGGESLNGESLTPEDAAKGSSSTPVRKAQNRIAQREFRMRKQIRDLEARVEVLSGDKEERVELMTLLVRNLLKENKELRSLTKSMAASLGEGLGSCLPRLGLSAPQLDAILSRADTDTAYEAFVALKASREMEEANPGLVPGEIRHRSSVGKRKHPHGDGEADKDVEGEGFPDQPGSGEPTKRNRQSSEGFNKAMESYSYLFPDLEAFAAPSPRQTGGFDANTFGQNSGFAQQTNNNYPQNLFDSPGYSGGSAAGQQMYRGSLAGAPSAQSNFTGFGLTVPASILPLPSITGGAPAQSNKFVRDSCAAQHPAAHPAPPPERITPEQWEGEDAERQRQLRAAVAQFTSNQTPNGTLDGPDLSPAQIEHKRRLQSELRQTMEETEGPDGKTDAFQLITYHLNNFRVNHSYILPPSLRPTRVQRTIPHEHAIDGIIYPSIRDRMILLRGRYDLVEVFHAMLNEFHVHGSDPLDHHNWEVSEMWLTQFKLLIDEEVYAISNKWRAERGESPLLRFDMRNDSLPGPGPMVAPPPPRL